MSRSGTKDQIFREIWLNYFNRVLLEKGLISEQEYNRIKIRIQSQTREASKR